MNNSFKKGIYFAFITAVISGFAIFFSGFAVKVVKDPYVLTASRNIIAAMILCAIMIFAKNRRAVLSVSKTDWLYLLLIGIVGGSIPFLLFFKGLSMSSPLVGGFIHKTMFVWVSFLAVMFLGEKIGKVQWAALAVLLAGNYLLGAFNVFKFGGAELMILAATLFWAVEYIIAKKVLGRLDSQVVAWARMFFGAIVLVIFIGFTGRAGSLLTFNSNQVFWVIFGALLLFGYVSFWYRALKLAPASLVTSILVVSSPISTFLTGLFINHSYSSNQIWGFVAICAGIIGFLRFKPRIKKQPELAGRAINP